MELHEKQYILSSNPLSVSACQEMDLGTFRLYLGENLECNIKIDKDYFLVLIGFAIDVNNPNMSNSDIFCELVNLDFELDEVLKRVKSLSGGWVILLSGKYKTYAINDSLGQRQIFYNFKKSGDIYLSSSAFYIAQINDYTVNSEATKYLDYSKTRSEDVSLPLEETMYLNIKRLLPNHLLDFHIKGSLRYFPSVKNDSSGSLDKTAIPLYLNSPTDKLQPRIFLN